MIMQRLEVQTKHHEPAYGFKHKQKKALMSIKLYSKEIEDLKIKMEETFAEMEENEQNTNDDVSASESILESRSQSMMSMGSPRRLQKQLSQI